MFNLFVCWFLITVNDYIEMCVIFYVCESECIKVFNNGVSGVSLPSC